MDKPAFPLDNVRAQRWSEHFDLPTSGLTRRELFAAMAMQSIMASDAAMASMSKAVQQGREPEPLIANMALHMADALIAELDK